MKNIIAITAVGITLGAIQPAHGITWREELYSLQQAESFGRDHVSFFGVGRGAGCTGNLIASNYVLSASHCPTPTSYIIRDHDWINVNRTTRNGDLDLQVVRLQSPSPGNIAGLYESADPNPVGKTFHKAGHGDYGPGGNLGKWYSKPAPLAGRNVYLPPPSAVPPDNIPKELYFKVSTTVASVGTASGDSGGPGLLKNRGGKWTISSVTKGFGFGSLIDAKVSTGRAWILAQL